MKVGMGVRELELGSDIGELRDSNALLDDMAALHRRFDEDGYILIRQLHNPKNVEAARTVLLQNLSDNRQIDMAQPIDNGAIDKENGRGAFMGGAKAVTHSPEFLSVVESPEVMAFFAEWLGGPSMTFDYKWLRAVGHGDFTGAHYDVVYMGRGTLKLYTLWTPLGDVAYEDGPLAILVGSHRGPEFEKVRETYGKMDVDRDNVGGWFSSDPCEMVEKFGGKWHSAEFRKGDAIFFGMYTMHGSLNNATNRYRLSCDTRYQRADEPADERWIGESPIAHYAWNSGDVMSMEEARGKQLGRLKATRYPPAKPSRSPSGTPPHT